MKRKLAGKRARSRSIPGLTDDGELIRRHWASLVDMAETTAKTCGSYSACPDLGTVDCLTCALGDARVLEVCDMECWACDHAGGCVCSRAGYMRRKG
jgi:hypothetical protein